MRFSIPIHLACCMFVFFSCNTTKRVAYFQDIPDAVLNPLTLPASKFKEPQIVSGDLLQITFLGPESLKGIVSLSSEHSAPGGLSEYRVDKQGNVAMPMIGTVQVKDLTTSAARDTIQLRMQKYFTEPIVNVRFANFTITVLGEVSKPSSYIVANEKVSVFDALGMAGDLTIFGKRENVLLLRDSCSYKKAVRLDLSTAAIIRSPYFYLLPGDVLYVEPNKAKISSLDASKTRNYALLASGLSVLIVLLSRFTF